jgi:serine/threonine protein kinase
MPSVENLGEAGMPPAGTWGLPPRRPSDETTVAMMGDLLPDSSPRVWGAQPIIAGRYRVVRVLGSGGMGEVYEAMDTELGDRIALKRMRAELTGAAAVARFRREARLARRVSHPNVCRVFDAIRGRDGELMLTMELLEGETLRSCLNRRGRLSEAEALPIAVGLAAGIDAIHRAGVVHRDVKCANVFLTSGFDARAVLTDFGVAQAHDHTPNVASQLNGSPAYMAPEHKSGALATASSDIYSFGVVLHEMVTGRLPEPGVSPRAHVPELDARWEAAILRCLAPRASDRFVRAGDVVAALGPERPRARQWAHAALLGVIAVAGMLVGYQLPRAGEGWGDETVEPAPIAESGPPAIVSHYRVGDRVRILDPEDGVYYPGRVLAVIGGERYAVHYAGYPDSDDEVVSMDRLATP